MLRLPRPHLKLPVRRTGTHDHDELAMSRGQILVLFVLSLTMLIGIMGLAIDVSFAWLNEIRVQNAADAAALAGAVYLPDNVSGGTSASQAVAVQNGYTNGSNNGTGTVVVNAQQDPIPYQMDVTISAPIPTFFMRVFGINSLTASRSAHAQYNSPLPMGSPLNVFGYPTATDLQGNLLNFWAAIQGPCTLKENGDPYATKDTTTIHTNCAAVTSPSNTEYKGPTQGDPGAYDYSIKVATSGTLSVQLYDPEFCQRSSQFDDTGDTAFSNQSSVNFNTIFTLYNPSSTAYDLKDDTVAATATYPGDGSTSSGPTHSCSSYYVHSVSGDYAAGGTGSICYPAGSCGAANPWIQFATIAVPAAGTYRLNVQTTTVGSSPADGSNMYAIQTTLNGGTSGVQVYGGGPGTRSTMSIYNNLASGTSYIYLAQVAARNAGKTLQISLFDPGDLNGTGVMSFEIPNSSGYSDASFTYRDSGTTLTASGTTKGPTTSVTTASGGVSNFNGHWLVVTINIPTTYTAPQGGWWKVKYVITGGAAHDRTTWNANILDITDHLVP
jgi:hypothetical protein